MKFHATSLQGVKRIEYEPRGDARGWLIRTYCEREFAEVGLNTKWVQSSETVTRGVGTLRGLHYQIPPQSEIKLIRCSKGRVFDVLLDLRRGSASYGKWESFELSDEAGIGLYVPVGIAHGFQTLADECVMQYQMSAFYDGELARGVRWDDKRLGILWPRTPTQLSERDQHWPGFAAAEGEWS